MLGAVARLCRHPQAPSPPSQVLLRWGLLQGCAVIPKSVQAHHIAEFSEQLLLSGGGGAAWSAEQDAAVLLAMAGLAEDEHKYCWDPAGIC